MKFNFHYCMIVIKKGVAMKFLLIISFLFSLLLSDTRLVIGCYKEQKNAEYAKIKIDKIIQKDANFKSFLKRNAISTKHIQIGEWNVISFEPFNDSTTMLKTYFKLNKMYPDTYKLEIRPAEEKEIITPPSDENMVAAKSVMPEPMTVENTQTTMHEAVEKTAADETTEAATMDKADENAAADMKVVEEESNPVTSYLFAIILILLLIVAVIVYMIQKKSNKTDLVELED